MLYSAGATIVSDGISRDGNVVVVVRFDEINDIERCFARRRHQKNATKPMISVNKAPPRIPAIIAMTFKEPNDVVVSVLVVVTRSKVEFFFFFFLISRKQTENECQT